LGGWDPRMVKMWAGDRSRFEKTTTKTKKKNSMKRELPKGPFAKPEANIALRQMEQTNRRMMKAALPRKKGEKKHSRAKIVTQSVQNGNSEKTRSAVNQEPSRGKKSWTRRYESRGKGTGWTGQDKAHKPRFTQSKVIGPHRRPPWEKKKGGDGTWHERKERRQKVPHWRNMRRQ